MVGAGTDRSRTDFGGGPAIVLVRPQLAVNIGMCARAMANFGLDDLRLVAPREGWPRTGEYRDVAYAAAAGAAHLLDGARVFATRRRGGRRPELPLRVDGARARPGQGGLDARRRRWRRPSRRADKRGVLFGPERTGLDNDEVALADEIVTFPANPAYASLNLAQAVLLVGYEWFKAAHGDAPPTPAVARAVSPPATREMTLAFFEFIEGKLDDAGFFRPIGKKPGMRRNLRNMFHRMAMTQQDVRTLWGAVVRLVEGPRAEPQDGNSKRVRAENTPPSPGKLSQ